MSNLKDLKYLIKDEEDNKNIKENKKKKPKQKDIFDVKNNKKNNENNINMIDEKMMTRLKEHSKLHKGGMRSKHIKNMMKYLKDNDNSTFTKAHNFAKKIDEKNNDKKNNDKKKMIKKKMY